jgi:hypothetical protein
MKLAISTCQIDTGADVRRNRAGVLLTRLDTKEPLYDSTVAWRGRAMRGIHQLVRLVRDARSRDHGLHDDASLFDGEAHDLEAVAEERRRDVGRLLEDALVGHVAECRIG